MYPSRPNSPQTVATHQRFVRELGDLTPLPNDTIITNVFKGLFHTVRPPQICSCLCLSPFRPSVRSVLPALARIVNNGRLLPLFIHSGTAMI